MNQYRERIKKQKIHYEELLALYQMVEDKENEIKKDIPQADNVTSGREINLNVCIAQVGDEFSNRVEMLATDEIKRKLERAS